jgi:hypothetical protein
MSEEEAFGHVILVVTNNDAEDEVHLLALFS